MPAELDQLDPAMSATPGAEPDMGADATPDMGAEPTGLAGGEVDHEGAMAKGELIKLASYAEKLQEHMQDDEQLEAWVQAKITMAAQNIASVYHYMAYEKKIGEYGDQLENNPALSEGQKQALSSYLMEAKMKIKELKKAQAEKIKSKKEEKMDEGIDGPCPHCGGAGHITRELPAHVKGKVDAYNRLTKATHAAHKRLDANHNGIPDEDEMEEDFETSKGGKVTINKDNAGKRTGLTHIGKPEWQADDSEYEAPKKEKAKGLSAAEKAPAKAMDKAQNKDYKAAKKANPEGVRRYQDGKQVDEAKKKGDGNLANNAKPYDKVTRGDVIAGRLGKDEKGGKAVKEAAKPSAGLSKEKKSATVKKAKAGGDIGKPGKNFGKVAAKAAEKYGSKEKGEKVAAAAMWKNIKETTAYVEAKKNDDIADKAEKMRIAKGTGTGIKGAIKDVVSGLKGEKPAHVNESADVARLREIAGRLNQNERQSLNESGEVASIRALTKRLNG